MVTAKGTTLGTGWATPAVVSQAQPLGGQNELGHGQLAAAQWSWVTAIAPAAGVVHPGPGGCQAIGHVQPPPEDPHCTLGHHHRRQR